MTQVTTTQQAESEIIQNLVLNGDLSKMTEAQKVAYYQMFCQSLGLNHLTQPFQIIKFQGKEKLYATKDCTEQLRKIHGVSIIDLQSQNLGGVYVVTAKAQDANGKTDASTGAVTIEGLKGENLANALMKAETKAKRRVTLSICGMGMLDESELDTMPNHTTEPIQPKETVTNLNITAAPTPEEADAIAEYDALLDEAIWLGVFNDAEAKKLQPTAKFDLDRYKKGIVYLSQKIEEFNFNKEKEAAQ